MAGQSVDRTGIVGEWKLDEGAGLVARDGSGHGHHGSIHYAAWRQSDGSNVLYFDGVNSRIVVPHSPSLVIQSDISICAWIWKRRPNGGRRWDAILAKNPGSWDYDLLTSKARSDQLALYSSGCEPVEVYSGPTLASGRWQHVAVTRKGELASCYIDGVATSRVGMKGLFPASEGSLVIGHDGANGRGFGMHGMIREVLLFSRALNDEEVGNLARAGRSG